jgi:hypothetical protein
MTEPDDNPIAALSEPQGHVQLRAPGALRRLCVTLPIVVAVFSLIAIFLFLFSTAAFLFAVITLPPFAVWSWRLFVWAGRQTLTGAEAADTRPCVEVTAAYLLLQGVGIVLSSVALLVVSLKLLLVAGLIGYHAYWLILGLYFGGLATAYFVFPERCAHLWERGLRADQTGGQVSVVARVVLVIGLSILFRALVWIASVWAVMGFIGVFLVLMLSLRAVRNLWRWEGLRSPA